jgi:recombination protein RecA
VVLHGGDRIGQGRDNACEFLRENPKIASDIETKLRVHLGLPVRGLTVVEGGAGAADADAQAKSEAAAESDDAKSGKKARATK